jgi:hypothetical protein
MRADRGLLWTALAVASVLLAGTLAWRMGAFSAGSDADEIPARDRGKKALRVLFVGNSYTFVGDLPGLVRRLASAADEPLRLEAVQECPGGATLRQQWESGRALALLQGTHFDWMILQGQSQELSFAPAQIETDVQPYVERLQLAAADAGARPLLFMTWGHRDGDPDNVRGDTYPAMQDRLTAGYEGLARRLRVPVAPVGVAWRAAAGLPGAPPLWLADGSHPSAAGSYLAACVIYAVLYQRSPLGNAFTAELDAADARLLQQVAADTIRGYVQP